MSHFRFNSMQMQKNYRIPSAKRQTGSISSHENHLGNRFRSVGTQPVKNQGSIDYNTAAKYWLQPECPLFCSDARAVTIIGNE
jgi:hypothetical protein